MQAARMAGQIQIQIMLIPQQTSQFQARAQELQEMVSYQFYHNFDWLRVNYEID